MEESAPASRSTVLPVLSTQGLHVLSSSTKHLLAFPSRQISPLRSINILTATSWCNSCSYSSPTCTPAPQQVSQSTRAQPQCALCCVPHLHLKGRKQGKETTGKNIHCPGKAARSQKNIQEKKKSYFNLWVNQIFSVYYLFPLQFLAFHNPLTYHTTNQEFSGLQFQHLLLLAMVPFFEFKNSIKLQISHFSLYF